MHANCMLCPSPLLNGNLEPSWQVKIAYTHILHCQLGRCWWLTISCHHIGPIHLLDAIWVMMLSWPVLSYGIYISHKWSMEILKLEQYYANLPSISTNAQHKKTLELKHLKGIFSQSNFIKNTIRVDVSNAVNIRLVQSVPWVPRAFPILLQFQDTKSDKPVLLNFFWGVQTGSISNEKTLKCTWFIKQQLLNSTMAGTQQCISIARDALLLIYEVL